MKPTRITRRMPCCLGRPDAYLQLLIEIRVGKAALGPMLLDDHVAGLGTKLRMPFTAPCTGLEEHGASGPRCVEVTAYHLPTRFHTSAAGRFTVISRGIET